jgi:AcrR family transcriptional regulator
LRERKRAQTAEQIEDGALTLFREQGYASTTVEDIAEAVDVSRATVFRYFPAKEDILFARDDADRECLVELAAAHRDAATFGAAVRSTVLAFVDHLVADADRLWLRWNIVETEPRLMGRCLVVVAGWSEAVVATIATDPDLRQRVVVSAAMSGLYEALRRGRTSNRQLRARVEDALDAVGVG